MASDAAAGTRDEGLRARPGKYLSFTLGGETYGIDVMQIQEIISLQPVTRVPHLPDFVRGVINLRGQVVPVVDLRHRFGLAVAADTPRTCIVVLALRRDGRDATLGVRVDEVCEVIDLVADDLVPPPRLGMAVGPDVVLGLGKVGPQVLILLDVDRVLARDELARVAAAGDVVPPAHDAPPGAKE